MPTTDLPLDQLVTYRGATPRPPDFDDYWTRAISEVAELGLETTTEPADFGTDQVECFHLYFTGVGGARIHAQVMRPARLTRPCPVMLVFHGYQSKVHDWYEELAFPLSGIAVVAMDVRGQSGLSQDNGQFDGSTITGHIIRGIRSNDPTRLFFRRVYQDTLQLARLVRCLDWVDDGAVSAVGFSQGGGLALACSGLCAMAGSPLATTVAGYPFLVDFQGLYQAGYPSVAHDEFVFHFRRQDPLHQAADRFFELLGYIDTQFLAEKITNPARVIATLRDEEVPPRTQFAAYNRLGSTTKDLVIYHDHGHEDLPGAWLGIFKTLMGIDQIGQRNPHTDYRQADLLLP